MIVVDTNVLSEPFRRLPEPRVVAWLDAAGSEVAITTVTVGELLFGALRLPDGRRRSELLDSIEQLVAQAGDRVLPFDQSAARSYGRLRAERESAGRPAGSEDLLIGSVCLARGLPLATRNVRHFEGFGIDMVNPWDAEPAWPSRLSDSS